jgi:hypothetical protein
VTVATLTPEAKQLLSTTIRALRERLLRDVQDEAERRYHLSVPLGQAGLDEAHERRRQRLDAWADERVHAVKTKSEKDKKAARERLLGQAVKEAGATLINRLVLIRHLEAMGLSKPQVVTGGWASKGYQEFRDFAPGLLDDETEGYATLLQMVFDDLAVDLPGLFGEVGLTKLFPIPPATLREVVTKLDAKELESAWTDDTTLGWVYQYWNDPEREALDAKINDGGKILPHEIASKTQMFTERYMVEWLLQNSLGLTWLCICKKNGWTPDAERVLPVLDARRAEWRKKRDAGEVALDALMPIEGELEDAWKYYVPQPIPDDAAEKAPDSLRNVKLLDPACGSGHFLVSAFGLFVAMYREEAKHRGETLSDTEIAESILANNLHGVDIDPRAIQIAAAALYLKAKTLAPKARPTRINLVAPTLQLGNLPDDDPSLAQLRSELKREAGIPEELTRRLVTALAGVDHLGTLLKVDSAVDDALREQEELVRKSNQRSFVFATDDPTETALAEGTGPDALLFSDMKATVLDKLEQFLSRHSASEDLGLRLDGEQLAAGVRFVRIVKDDQYDIVIGNPPYLGTQRLADCSYVDKHYRAAKEDLYSVFIERSLQCLRHAGLMSLVTIRSWMFVSHFQKFRELLLHRYEICVLADLGAGGFEAVPGVEAAMLVARNARSSEFPSAALRAHGSKRMDLLVQSDRFLFSTELISRVDGCPIVYHWTRDYIQKYLELPKLGNDAPARVGMKTSDNVRFVREPWEIFPHDIDVVPVIESRIPRSRWIPYIKGAGGKTWLEPLSDVVLWALNGLQIRLALQQAYGQGPQCERLYFTPGVAFTTIARRFLARAHRYRSIFDVAGSSVFHANLSAVVCLLNSARARQFVETINPTINFQVGDVNRLPVFPIENANGIFAIVEEAFSAYEEGRESSFEFVRPKCSPWRYAQDWAQRAVDRAEGEPLPPYEPECDPPEPEAYVSFGVGVALGRFGANGEGILPHPTTPSPRGDQRESGPGEDSCEYRAGGEGSLPAGILFVTTESSDSLEHPACSLLQEAWKEHGPKVGCGDDLGTYLRTSFFAYHKKLYENRPIYFPLSSAKKSYVAYASIHRWKDDTLNVLLADHLVPEKRRLEGELEDIRKARTQAAGKGKAEKRFAEVQKLLEELTDFIDKVRAIAECGPPPPDDKTPKREVDARFTMDLDDGVMVNSAALWPLLEPQWKDPKKWWKELATAQGRKDYDWSHLAARYFPKRVREKCVTDPSLAVAHKCFWELHPAKAYASELRLQDEIRPDVTIDEPSSDSHRALFLKAQAKLAKKIKAAETKRRERKAAKAEEEDNGPLFDQGDQDGEEADA